MKLIKVETQGFKSFADKTVLTFDGGVVGVVGPNGSGKSNINDAIKWVLGEQSIKSLRGDSSDDIIFSGSKKVSQMNKAEVSLTFDNEDGRVSLPHKTFTITRVVERGKGENSYFINGEPAKLKDIREVAMESGIGKSSLAIISQGTISDIAEATPEARRAIFEEAAGISKYKSKKTEALRKLDRTTEALEKVEAVTSELEKQLKPLQKQAEKAKIYLEKRTELEKVEIGLIAEDVKFFSTKLEALNIELEDVVSAKDSLNEKINNHENELKDKTNYKLVLENEIHSLDEKYKKIETKINEINISNSKESQRRQMIIDGQLKGSSTARLEAMKEELNELTVKLAKYEEWESKTLKDVEESKTKLSELQPKYSKLSSELSFAKNEQLKAKTNLSFLQNQRENKTNLYKGTKTIIDNQNIFSGFQGIVSDLLKINEKYSVAIETVLSSSLQHIVVETPETAIKAVRFLKQNNGGRATFIPLSVIKPKGIHETHLMALEAQKGFIGVASDLIDSNVKHEILKKFLLGHILVADTIENAQRISDLINSRYMVVSLTGDLIRAGGTITGGQSNNSSVLNIDKQIEELEKKVPSFDETIQKTTSEISNLHNVIEEQNYMISHFNIEMARVAEKKQLAEKQFRDLKTTYESESNEKFDSSQVVLESADFLESEKSTIEAQLKAKKEAIMSINKILSTLTLEKTEFEKTLRNIIESSSEKMTQKNQADYILKTSKERLSEEYEMTLEMASTHTLSIPREEAREIVSKLRNEIKELGHINIDAIEQFDEINERYTKLKKSEDELFSAQQTIISAIDEMDKIIISKLDETVKIVNSEMSNIFKTMFGGGHAEVKYIDPKDLLNTGIDVIAQPPGKTIKNLKLFSGGEKALVAISLLFAILKSKPLPLCILDEVEAALDDANVVRYASYLQELKHQTQFIVVTHRVGTMARVDHLFGATMQTRGVTSFFTVKLNEAKKLLEK